MYVEFLSSFCFGQEPVMTQRLSKRPLFAWSVLLTASAGLALGWLAKAVGVVRQHSNSSRPYPPITSPHEVYNVIYTMYLHVYVYSLCFCVYVYVYIYGYTHLYVQSHMLKLSSHHLICATYAVARARLTFRLGTNKASEMIHVGSSFWSLLVRTCGQMSTSCPYMS